MQNSSEMERKREIIEWSDLPDDSKDELLWILFWNELNKDDYEDEDLFDAHKFHEELGFVPWAYVKLSYDAEVWQIVGYNHGRGLYTGVRYPLKIKFQRGTFEWGVYALSYDQIIWYKEKYGSAKDALDQIEETPMLELVDDQEAELIIDTQKLISKMTDEEFWLFIESWELEEIDLPYIREFAEDELERRTRN